MANKTIALTVPHQLTQDQARMRIQGAVADLKRGHAARISNVEEQWTGDHLDFRLAVMGKHITGRLDVRPQDVRLEVDVPWMLAMLAGRLTKQVEAEGRKLLA